MITALGRRKRVVPLRPLSFVDSAIQFEFCHHPHSLSPSVKPNLNSIVVQIDIPPRPKRRTRPARAAKPRDPSSGEMVEFRKC